jgi:hypothetical protein
MKIRNGFVSNSSSSSFTCEVCGETQSGMDMCRSEAGMVECENGHTFCESHEIAGPDVSLENKRERLFDDVEKSSYYQTRPREKAVELDTISNYTEDEVDESYKDKCEDDGHAAESCPICMFKDLDESRALRYLLQKNGLTEKTLLEELKAKFTTYVEFTKFVDGK